MTVAATSLVAYDNLRASGTLCKRQQQIMRVIQPGNNYSLQEISRLSGVPINVVSGRVNELKSSPLLLLEHGIKRKCSITGSTVQTVQRTTPEAG